MSGTDPAHAQASWAVRLEWGPTGGAAVAAGADVAVVVDVLSFTTTLTVALDRGMTVYPFAWKDARAEAYAAERDAVLAVGRLEASQGQAGVSLSPASMLAVDGVERVVLPSPNGSSIAFALAGLGCVVVGASLRNAGAVGSWLRPQVESGARVAVVPAGERWPDGSLRPSVEDLWGAGAVLSSLDGSVELSPEARLAVTAHAAARDDLREELVACASGAELVDKGFASDVWIAAESDVSDIVPVLDGEAFHPAP
ncbi:2-phosphosulfolactate phosphatase [Nocardioides sp.]|uniref:2-phosphosulfolactate phosphatase n=1 Tax=Nocardioides sp. TaxID=35761 RepID=UPI00272607ED|nr:2-phosphosulfolactate phosphatase [Nocardioides sp.]MDO9455193.1 2-phosphosulfolactate phosphatase [Nocardioides sp.]